MMTEARGKVNSVIGKKDGIFVNKLEQTKARSLTVTTTQLSCMTTTRQSRSATLQSAAYLCRYAQI